MVVELIAAASLGAAAGMAIAERILRPLIRAQKAMINDLSEGRLSTFCTLSALRSNCFITNERGHRVRYVNASVECRAKAEAPKEATGWRVP